MIFVTLGTTKYPFLRPLKEMEGVVKKGEISESVIVQAGYSDFRCDFMTVKDFFSPDELNSHYSEANLIMTHGGTGSIMKGLELNKKVLVLPRLKKYGEHIDDHQLEVAGELEKDGHLLVWHDGEDLLEKIQETRNFEPIPYRSKNEEIIDYLVGKIDGW